MDQAISLLARPGAALHIQFDPIRVAPVPISPAVTVVIVVSGPSLVFVDPFHPKARLVFWPMYRAPKACLLRSCKPTVSVM
jgi:hypothetical protein